MGHANPKRKTNHGTESNLYGPECRDTAQKQNWRATMTTAAPTHTRFLKGMKWMTENVRWRKVAEMQVRCQTRAISIKFCAYKTAHCSLPLQCNQPASPKCPKTCVASAFAVYANVLREIRCQQAKAKYWATDQGLHLQSIDNNTHCDDREKSQYKVHHESSKTHQVIMVLALSRKGRQWVTH